MKNMKNGKSQFIPAVLLACTAAAFGQATRPAPKINFTIGKGTTFLTDPPLRADGTVDYVKAYDAMLRTGITLENNAFIPVLKALGPAYISKTTLDATLEALGIKDLPATGAYFQPLAEYLHDQGIAADEAARIDEQITLARTSWNAEKFPQLAAWIKVNEKPLNAVAEAVLRDNWYVPAVKTESMVGLLYPALGQQSDLARCLGLRAALRCSDGEVDAAWKDALAIHRLGRLVSKGGSLIERLLGYSIDGRGVKADQAILASGKLTAAQAAACLTDLQRLGPFATTADAINTCERFEGLDVAMLMARGKMGKMQGFLGEDLPASLFALSDADLAAINWDTILHDLNHEYDLLVAASASETFVQRLEAFRQAEVGIQELKKTFPALLADPDPTKQLSAGLRALLLPELGRADVLYERALMLADLDQIGFALAAYRAERGAYPETLAALAPAYLKSIPQDRFTDKPLIYKPSGSGFLLYSVNDDLEDNGGNETRDPKGHYDLVVRVGGG